MQQQLSVGLGRQAVVADADRGHAFRPAFGDDGATFAQSLAQHFQRQGQERQVVDQGQRRHSTQDATLAVCLQRARGWR
jgi:hypothetical protein